MILSSDELEILDFLKAIKGDYVSMQEICRRAGGRKKFLESPNWAKPLMSRLVEVQLIEFNGRGHYRYRMEEDYFAAPEDPVKDRCWETGAKFQEVVIDDNYFPSADACESDLDQWIAPADSGKPGDTGSNSAK